MEQSHGTTFSRAGLAQAAHPAVSRLPLGARAVYVALCGLLAVGQPRRVSQELIAEEACVSEATVSTAMPVLVDCGLVARSVAPDGRGYELTLLPLPAPPDPDERLAGAQERLRAKRDGGGDPDPDGGDAGPEGGAQRGPGDGGAGDGGAAGGPPRATARPQGGSRGDPVLARPAGQPGGTPGRSAGQRSRMRSLPARVRGGSRGDPVRAKLAQDRDQEPQRGATTRVLTPPRPTRRETGSRGDPVGPAAIRRATPTLALEARERVRVRQTAMVLAVGSGDDPAGCMDDHDLESYKQQQQPRVRELEDQEGLPVVSEAAWERMVLGTPGYTTAHFAADYRALLARGKTGAQAIGLIVWARARGEAIWSADDLEMRAQRYHARTCPDVDASAAPPRHRPRRERGRQHPQILRSKPFDLDAHAARVARLERLLPPDATEDDELDLCSAFDAGLDDDAALARMEEGRRGRRA